MYSEADQNSHAYLNDVLAARGLQHYSMEHQILILAHVEEDLRAKMEQHVSLCHYLSRVDINGLLQKACVDNSRIAIEAIEHA